MHDKGKLATYIDITKQTIIICWIALFSFWAIKLFGGNFFEILVENENFVKFCEYAENSWLKDFINLITISISNYFILGAINQTFYFKGKRLVFVIFVILSKWAIRFIPNFIGIHFWYGYVILILYAIITNENYNKLLGLFAVVLDFAFTTISIIVRNIPMEINTNFLIGNILLIDLYIMYILYYLYCNFIKLKKEK